MTGTSKVDVFGCHICSRWTTGASGVRQSFDNEEEEKDENVDDDNIM